MLQIMDRLRWALVVTVMASALGTGGSARAQTTDPSATLELVRQPVSHSPEDRLGLTVRVTNSSDAPLEGFRIQVLAYSRVLSRSDLHQSFDGPTGLFGSLVRFYDQVSVGPGLSTVVTIDNPIADFQTIARSSEGGVFPVTVTLIDALERPLDSFTTQVIYYPQTPELPLNLALVFPLNERATRGPDGTFVTGSETEVALADAVSDTGWLSVWLDALEGPGRSLHVGIAPVPRLLEELADMSDGFRWSSDGVQEAGDRSDPAVAAETALERLRTVFRRPGIQPLFVPYSFPDLPSLHDAFAPEEVVEQRQFAEAELVLTSALGQRIRPRWLYPPAGRLDRPSLERARALSPETARYALFAPQALVDAEDPAEAGCPVAFASFTCAVSIETVAGQSQGLVADLELQSRFEELGREGAERLDLQRLLAETAMIREELPGVPDRVIHAVVPGSWHPAPRIGHLLVASIARAPWLETVTPAEALRRAPDIVNRDLVDSLPAPANIPDPSFFAAITASEDLLRGFREIGPPVELARRLDRNVLTAQSRNFWTEEDGVTAALNYATQARDEALEELGKISIGGSDAVTLTSQRGEIQLVVTNGTDYPVSLDIEIRSNSLEVEPPDIDRFEPGTTQVDLEVSAASSGVSPLEISLRTRNGFVVGSPKSIQVRSTDFNDVALAITLGALAFLILFYAFRSLRKRGGPAASPDAPGASAA